MTLEEKYKVLVETLQWIAADDIQGASHQAEAALLEVGEETLPEKIRRGLEILGE